MIEQITEREALIGIRNSHVNQIAMRRIALATTKSMKDTEVVAQPNVPISQDQNATTAITAKNYRDHVAKEIENHENLIKVIDDLINGNSETTTNS